MGFLLRARKSLIPGDRSKNAGAPVKAGREWRMKESYMKD